MFLYNNGIFLRVKRIVKENFVLLLFPAVIYCLFFFPVLGSGNVISGADGVRYSYPARYHLWNSLINGSFPFWTEKLFGGHVIYTDSEHAYTSVLNILSIILFGPFNSYKFLHFIFYYLGSTSLLIFLKRKSFTTIASFSSVLIYFFSFFLLYHQQHFSMTLTAYLIPTGILFLDYFLSSLKIRWVVALSFLTNLIISFGSYQMVVIFMLALLLYLVSFLPSQRREKVCLNLLFYLALTFFLSLPHVLPTAQSYLRGTRYDKGVSYVQGSFNPLMWVNLLYPYAFGKGENYKWNTVSSDYQIHETYIYIGISSLILGVLGYLNTRDTKIKKFISVCILTFLILGFLNYIPVINKINIPIIGSFRYWGRSVIILVFAAAIASASCLTNPVFPKFRDIISNRLYIIFFLIFVVQLIVSFYVNDRTSIILQQIKNRAVVIDNEFYTWLVISVVTILLFLVMTKARGARVTNILCSLLIGLLIFDLYYFGNSIVRKYTRGVDDLYDREVIKVSTNYNNNRILILSEGANYNFGLYLKSWGILGYSQFTPASREDLIRSVGIQSSKVSSSDVIIEDLHKIGVGKVLDSDGNVLSNFPQVDFTGNFNGEILSKEIAEGRFHYKVISNESQEITTFISNHPDWIIKINGEKIKPISKEGSFLSFSIPAGDVDISVIFVPKLLYLSIIISAVGVASSTLIYRKFSFNRNAQG